MLQNATGIYVTQNYCSPSRALITPELTTVVVHLHASDISRIIKGGVQRDPAGGRNYRASNKKKVLIITHQVIALPPGRRHLQTRGDNNY